MMDAFSWARRGMNWTRWSVPHSWFTSSAGKVKECSATKTSVGEFLKFIVFFRCHYARCVNKIFVYILFIWASFMENLQSEVLQIEFNEFSKGLPVISELDFAKILLRYTLLQSEDYEAYLNRLSQRIQHKQANELSSTSITVTHHRTMLQKF